MNFESNPSTELKETMCLRDLIFGFSKKTFIAVTLFTSTLSVAEPLVTFDRGIPVVSQGSILRQAIDDQGHSYFDELLELNLLAYELGKGFQALGPERERFIYSLETERGDSPISDSPRRLTSTGSEGSLSSGGPAAGSPTTPTSRTLSQSLLSSFMSGGEPARVGDHVLTLQTVLDYALCIGRDRCEPTVPFSHASAFYTQRFNGGQNRMLNHRPRDIYIIKGKSGDLRGGSGQRDFPGLVSYDEDRLLITVTLRGSQGSMDAPDWTTNLNAEKMNGSEIMGENFQGSIHKGFGLKVRGYQQSLFSILDRILGHVDPEDRSKVRIFFTGHSQGAALAILTAGATVNYLQNNSELMGMPEGEKYDNVKENRVQSYRFASPRPFAGEDSVRSMDLLLGRQNDIRQNVRGDVVPSQPARSSGFHSYGYLAFEKNTRFHLEARESAVRSCMEVKNQAQQTVAVACDALAAARTNAFYTTMASIPHFVGTCGRVVTAVCSIPTSALRFTGSIVGVAASGVVSQHSLPLERHWSTVIGSPGKDRQVIEQRPDFNDLLKAGFEEQPQTGAPVAVIPSEPNDEFFLVEMIDGQPVGREVRVVHEQGDEQPVEDDDEIVVVPADVSRIGSPEVLEDRE